MNYRPRLVLFLGDGCSWISHSRAGFLLEHGRLTLSGSCWSLRGLLFRRARALSPPILPGSPNCVGGT